MKKVLRIVGVIILLIAVLFVINKIREYNALNTPLYQKTTMRVMQLSQVVHLRRNIPEEVFMK